MVKAGDVQWTTAGRGIIHAEAPTKAFVKQSGYIEGIQLWLNLPAEKKMIPAAYQHEKHDDFRVVTSKDKNIITKIVAGELDGVHGRIKTQTSVNAFVIDAKSGGETEIEIPESHNALLYLLSGDIRVNNSEELKLDAIQILEFNRDGNGISLKANADSKLLLVSGEPFNEPVATYGPYVMNTQTEILEAMRDFQSGKMGFLPAN